MKLDWSAAGLLSLSMGIIAIATGSIEDSRAWVSAGIGFLLIWFVLCIFAALPGLRVRVHAWLENPQGTESIEISLEQTMEMPVVGPYGRTNSDTHLAMPAIIDDASSAEIDILSQVAGDTRNSGLAPRRRLRELVAATGR